MKPIDFSKPRLVMLIGKPECGKSWAVTSMILDNVGKHFKVGLIFSNTVEFTKQYNFMANYKNLLVQGYNENKLITYVNYLKKWRKKHNDKPISNFVYFDDLVGIMNNYKHMGFLTNFFTIHRHLGTSVFLSSQVLKASTTSPLFRNIVNYGIFFWTNKNDIIEAIYNEFATEYDNYEQFKRHFLAITEPPYSAMFYSQDIRNKKDNFFRIVFTDKINKKYKILF